MRTRHALVPILVMLTTTRANAQADTTNSVPHAFALIQASRYQDAIRMLETLTTREPVNPRAWSLLGLARYQAKDLPGALAADLKAAEYEQTKPVGLYNAGLMYALMGQRDSAFSYLLRAKATNRIDLTQIGGDTDATSLRGDARWAQLFPSAEEFAHPFIEPVTIIREWRGEAAGDQFGWIARNTGDIDGDGINDVTTSAPTSNAGGTNSGRVNVYSTGTGRLLWARNGSAGEQLGLGIEAAGDVNDDGIPDVVAGAPGGGKAYVLSGKDGSTLLTLTAEDKGDGFGRHVADLGDVNGDHYADILIGAPTNDAGGTDAGRAYVFSGKDGSVLLTLTGERPGDTFGSTAAGAVRNGNVWILVGAPAAGPNRTGRTYVYQGLTTRPTFVIESDSTGVALGAMFISVVGDVNHDGTPDMYASDFSNSARGRGTGRVYVYSGKTGMPLLTLTGDTAGEGFGIGPADAGDVNGDGYDDLVIGAWQFSGTAPSGGKVYVYSGRDASLLRTITGRVPGETLGFDATGLGDVNHDGIPDMLVTSAWSAVTGTHSGRVFVLAGQ
jgi:hypothetical protein